VCSRITRLPAGDDSNDQAFAPGAAGVRVGSRLVVPRLAETRSLEKPTGAKALTFEPERLVPISCSFRAATLLLHNRDLLTLDEW
jgi:hypothetical protein